MSEDDFVAATKTADTRFKSSQAELFARADREAGRLFVDYRAPTEYEAILQGLSSTDRKILGARRKQQFEYLRRYVQSLRDEVAADPKMTGVAFEVLKADLRTQYWNELSERQGRGDYGLGGISDFIEQRKFAKAAGKLAEKIREIERKLRDKEMIEAVEGPALPTAAELTAKAAATSDLEERKRIYEQGKKLGYWK